MRKSISVFFALLFAFAVAGCAAKAPEIAEKRDKYGLHMTVRKYVSASLDDKGRRKSKFYGYRLGTRRQSVGVSRVYRIRAE